MSYKLGIIHTTKVTIDPLEELTNKYIEDCDIINILDDSILTELIDDEKNINNVEKRWRAYANFAYEQGVDCILSACSTVGEIANKINDELNIPVLRIDEPMIDYAIDNGCVIAVGATLSTTLYPTIRLLKKKSEMKNKKIQTHQVLLEDAYIKLKNGDKKGHDKMILEEMRKLANKADIVILAQASMASAMKNLSQNEKKKFVTSPKLGIKNVRDILRSRN